MDAIKECVVPEYDNWAFEFFKHAQANMKENLKNRTGLEELGVKFEQQLTHSKKCKLLILENMSLLNKMSSFMISKNDKLLSDYIEATQLQIKERSNDPEQLQAINGSY